MFNNISHMMLYVRDQDEAKDYYVSTLGMELGDDVPFGEDFRWLTVHLPGQSDTRICLMPPHAGKEPELAKRVGELLALGGLMGGILTTEDCHAAYAQLRSRGVEFSEEPTERFYGIDCGFRDPSGNPWRLTQPAPVGSAPEALSA
ncbi:MAG: VOC family protein [Solirubrobacteraceae bacterium]